MIQMICRDGDMVRFGAKSVTDILKVIICWREDMAWIQAALLMNKEGDFVARLESDTRPYPQRSLDSFGNLAEAIAAMRGMAWAFGLTTVEVGETQPSGINREAEFTLRKHGTPLDLKNWLNQNK